MQPRRKAEESVGEVFGLLTVLGVTRDAKRRAIAHAECACGGRWEGLLSSLRFEQTVSCGCVRKSKIGEVRRTHGMANKHPLYNTWILIKQRCTNPKSTSYRLYGERGIQMSAAWQASFTTFLADMGPRPSAQHSIDRIDNAGNYCKENCRWATAEEQANNQRRNLVVEFRGETLTLSQLADKYKVNYDLLRWRYHKGWDLEEAVTRPSRDMYEKEGEIRTLQEWSEALNLNYTTLYMRVRGGTSGLTLVT